MTDTAPFLAGLPLLQARARNMMLDCMLHDVGSLSGAERARLSGPEDLDGRLLRVPPTGAGELAVLEPGTPSSGLDAGALAVGGMGGSALGTAALARNVADALGVAVLAPVPSYDAGRALADAFGGWMAFGVATAPDDRADDDAARLASLLRDRPRTVTHVVAHGRGCLLLREALRRLEGAASATGGVSSLEDLRVVTLGAVVDLPRGLPSVRQILGALDGLGGLNSRLDLPHESVARASHHLNRGLPLHLDAVTLLRAAVVRPEPDLARNTETVPDAAAEPEAAVAAVMTEEAPARTEASAVVPSPRPEAGPSPRSETAVVEASPALGAPVIEGSPLLAGTRAVREAAGLDDASAPAAPVAPPVPVDATAEAVREAVAEATTPVEAGPVPTDPADVAAGAPPVERRKRRRAPAAAKRA